MARPLTGRRNSGPWFSRFGEVIRFERGARTVYPGLKVRQRLGSNRIYEINMPVPHYDARLVEIRFPAASPHVPRVTVDGPEPHHNYGKNALCMWCPSDPRCERWVFEDGLLQLLGLTQRHLFMEAWYLEHEEWLGPEAPHGPDLAKRRGGE